MLTKKHSFEFKGKSVKHNGKNMSKFDIEYVMLHLLGVTFFSEVFSKAECVDSFLFHLKRKISRNPSLAQQIEIIRIYVDL